MADVVLPSSIRSNLLSMQNTTRMLDETNLRLSTGLKVNSAIDSPTAFFTAQGLNNRASDLNNLLDSMGQGVQTLKAADEGIKSILSLVDTLKSTANQALETKLKPTTLTGNAGTTLATDGSDTLSSLNLTAGTKIVVTVGEATQTFTVGTPATGTTVTTVQDLIDAVNAESAASGEFENEGVAAAIVDGQLQLTAGSGHDIAIAGNDGGSPAATVSLSALTGTHLSANDGVNRDKFEKDYNDLRDQITQLAKDASYKGVNLLNGDDLSIFFNSEQTSKLDISGVTLTPDADLNIAAIGNEPGNHGFLNDTDIQAAIDSLNSATGVLRQQSSTFGANLGVVEIRQDFTKNLINTLETGASNLTVADSNEEGAKLLTLQTRQSLGTTALSLANQSEQSVLRLFG
ncbi:MAG: flagellar protein [Rhizobiales bacterium]|nr:flagellar protein [Hyphomicrobiales bacterium]